MSSLQRILLYPFAIIWDGITSLRNYSYDNGIRSSQEFDLPLIGVGNLSLGGTGKSPHVEYLIRLLQETYHVGVLSRGYKRKTNGYRLANLNSTADEVGDESLQMKLKYPRTAVAVSESRVMGVPKLLLDDKEVKVILLDDVFQHRAIKPGFNILLTDIDNLYADDAVLPAGLLRESSRGAKRADVIIVSKCPADLSKFRRAEISEKLNVTPSQQLFFTTFKYGLPYNILNSEDRLSGFKGETLLVSGIARPEYLKEALENQYGPCFLFDYPDHHRFHERDIYDVSRAFENLNTDKKAIIITEKDAVKWRAFGPLLKELKLDVYVQPIFVDFLTEDGSNDRQAFDHLIMSFLSSYYE